MSNRSVASRLLVPFSDLPKSVIVGLGVLLWVLLIALWYGLNLSGLVKEIFLPTPGKVFQTLHTWALDGRLWEHSYSSIQVVLIGFVVSSCIAIPLGLVMGTYRAVQAFLDPLVVFFRYLPVTAFIPLFILWIGIGLEQRVTVIIFGIFFQQLVMIADSVRSVDRDLINAAYTLGTKRHDTLRQIILPATLPNIIDVMRVSMGLAWTYLVVAELVAARSGLGYIALNAMRGFQVDVIFMAIVVIGLLGLLFDGLFRLLRRAVAPWAS